MSKGLTDLQNTIQSYGSSADALNNFVQNYDSSFFSDWREKVALKSQKLESARKIGADTGVAYLAGSTIKSTAKKLFGKPQSEETQEEPEAEPEAQPENEAPEVPDEPEEERLPTMEDEFAGDAEDEDVFQGVQQAIRPAATEAVEETGTGIGEALSDV